MTALNGEQVLMRIFLSEADKHHAKPLYHEIIELLRTEKIAGATVLRGICGFGAKSHIHTTSLLTLSQNLPIVIEVIDTQANIDKVWPKIDGMLEEGLVTTEKVNVLRQGKREQCL